MHSLCAQVSKFYGSRVSSMDASGQAIAQNYVTHQGLFLVLCTKI